MRDPAPQARCERLPMSCGERLFLPRSGRERSLGEGKRLPMPRFSFLESLTSARLFTEMGEIPKRWARRSKVS